MLNRTVQQFIDRMPKAELHVHLEGSIDLSTVKKLAEVCGETVDEMYHYNNFRGFLSTYKKVCQLLRRLEDFELITYEMLTRLAEQNVRYAEVFISPSIHWRGGLPMDKVLENVYNGRDRAFVNFGIETKFIFDAVRQWGVKDVDYMVDLAIENMGEGVVGIGIGGDEIAAPPELFAQAYERAKRRGLGLTAHAGEVAGATSVWNAIKFLKVDRIGHGIKSEEDTNLLRYLAEKQVPLDLCPTSNLRTGAIQSIEEHPIRKFFDAGLFITLNSDDPAIFSTTLTEEYLLLADRFGFTTSEIKTLVLNSLHASFLPPERKRLKRSLFEAEINRLEQALFATRRNPTAK